MRAWVLAGALALTACNQTSAPEEDPLASVRGCDAVATSPWAPEGGGAFAVEAASFGPDCARAVATLVVRDAQGKVIWSEAYPAESVMVLAPAQTPDAMQSALADWVNSSNHTIATTSALPDWPAGAAMPVSGEFPFYPEQGWDRDTYLALREADVPVLCYVQGMESQACLALQSGILAKIGVQTFPG